MKRWCLRGGLAFALMFLAGTNARALTIGKTNLVSLIRDSNSILIATVSTVTDGIDDSGLPYTEITLSVGETLRGAESGTFAFRQIGLMNPRLTADGTKMMLPAPEGIPKYTPGEQLLLFLSPAASMTGLRSTAGLGNGRFVLGPGSALNDLGNDGVFQSVSLADDLATDNDNRILATTMGSVNADDLLSLVRRAVQGSWVENCRMWDTDEGPTCGGAHDPISRRAPARTTNPLPTSVGTHRIGVK